MSITVIGCSYANLFSLHWAMHDQLAFVIILVKRTDDRFGIKYSVTKFWHGYIHREP